MIARDADRLAALEGMIEGAKAFPCDVADLDALVATVAKVRDQLGAPAIVVHNAVGAVRGSILELDPTEFEKNFRVNATALLYLARETIPAMLAAGKGAIMVTGNTSETRGKAHWASSPRARQRSVSSPNPSRASSAPGAFTSPTLSSTPSSIRRAPARSSPPTSPTTSSPSPQRSPKRSTGWRIRTARPGRLP
jgi:NAD(P)-dependent dehydrogenase (short-subunit alcohol dehydrogenase family)